MAEVKPKDINDLWEEVLTLKAMIEEWPHGPCNDQVRKIHKDLEKKLNRHADEVRIGMQAMQGRIDESGQQVHMIGQRSVEYYKAAMEAVKGTDDMLREFNARIQMVQDFNHKMQAMWDSVLNTIGFKLDFVPARYEVKKLEEN